jgi:hypothetical protein
MNTLQNVFSTVLETESKLIPLFVHNPESQAIAGVAMLGEAALFNLISALHAKTSTATATAAN